MNGVSAVPNKHLCFNYQKHFAYRQTLREIEGSEFAKQVLFLHPESTENFWKRTVDNKPVYGLSTRSQGFKVENKNVPDLIWNVCVAQVKKNKNHPF